MVYSREISRSYSEVSLQDSDMSEEQTKKQKFRRGLCRCCKITTITIFCLLLALFIIVFVILPLVFMWSIEVQRFVMFPNFDQPSNPEYNNFEKYNVSGVRNIYIPVTDMYTNKTIHLGTWHLLPEELEQESNDYDFDAALRDSGHPVVIYFHGNSGTRIAPLHTYRTLRKTFHVLGYDYRDYGDSTPALRTEPAVVNDGVQLYKWVKERTNADIYVWGHSLGTALSTHTVKVLKSEGIVPKGLFLEAPFTTMREELKVHPLGKLFAWLPYFEATVLDPLERNGFHFKTRTNILDVDCPIMISNAEDDVIIPYTLGQESIDMRDGNKNVEYSVFDSNRTLTAMECSSCNRETTKKAIKIFFIVLGILLFLLFTLVFVILPIVFQHSIWLQRLILFTNVNLPNDWQVFEAYENQTELKNFYVPSEDAVENQTVYLGTWHLFPRENGNISNLTESYNHKALWGNDSLDTVVIYFHGAGESRKDPMGMYNVLRTFFHVIAFDYRSYADSTDAELFEDRIVNDCLQLCSWIQANFNFSIYFWGHSLGSALAANTVSRLKEVDIIPMGLVLESAFTSMREELPLHKYGKIFAWLPWFSATILDPIDQNGFYFNTSKHILQVDCPIMLLHAEDDSIVPCDLGRKLYEIGSAHRNRSVQGSITYHEFDAELRYNHYFIYEDPHLPEYIKDFVKTCTDFRDG